MRWNSAPSLWTHLARDSFVLGKSYLADLNGEKRKRTTAVQMGGNPNEGRSSDNICWRWVSPPGRADGRMSRLWVLRKKCFFSLSNFSGRPLTCRGSHSIDYEHVHVSHYLVRVFKTCLRSPVCVCIPASFPSNRSAPEMCFREKEAGKCL